MGAVTFFYLWYRCQKNECKSSIVAHLLMYLSACYRLLFLRAGAPALRGPFNSLPKLIFFPSVIWTVLCGIWCSKPSPSVMPWGSGMRTQLTHSWETGGVVEMFQWPAFGGGGGLGHFGPLCFWLLTQESPNGSPWLHLAWLWQLEACGRWYLLSRWTFLAWCRQTLRHGPDRLNSECADVCM